MVIKNDNLNKYIAGIYNYCDRWCEKCLFKHKCLLFAREQKIREEHIEKGEDPDDWKYVMEDIKNSFKEALEILHKVAEEQGIVLDEIDINIKDTYDPKDHPVYIEAEKFMKDAGIFIKKLAETIKEEGVDLSERMQIIPDLKDEFEGLKEILECYEIIGWYHTLIAAKIYRALGSITSNHPDIEDADSYDKNGSAKVAYISLMKTLTAFQKLYEWNEKFEDDILNLMIRADRLCKMIDRVFPGHHNFKRPGFDD